MNDSNWGDDPIDPLPPVFHGVRVVVETADKRITYETDNPDFFSEATRSVSAVFYMLESR